MRSRWRANGEGERRRSPTGSSWRLRHGVAKDPQRSGGRRHRTFLILGARNGGLLLRPPGEKSSAPPLRYRRSRRQPAFATIRQIENASERNEHDGANDGDGKFTLSENSGKGLRRPIRRHAAEVGQRRIMPESARYAGSSEVSGATVVQSTAIEAAQRIGCDEDFALGAPPLGPEG